MINGIYFTGVFENFCGND